MKFRFTGLIINESEMKDYFREFEIAELLKLNVGDSIALTRHNKAYQATRTK